VTCKFTGLTATDYFKILGLDPDCSVDEIKKAYRAKAREYHPDINHSPEAKDMFIIVTEAYEFLLTYFEKMRRNEEAYNKAMDDWRKYRQARSRRKARVYAKTSYVRFKNTNFYKTTRIFDATTVISSLLISVLVLIAAVYGYIFRIHHPIPGVEDPSVSILVIFILLGLILFTMSVVHFRIYLQASKRHKDKSYD
jgi:hypothetical protein